MEQESRVINWLLYGDVFALDDQKECNELWTAPLG